MERQRFEELVRQALDELPEEIAERMSNVDIEVQDSAKKKKVSYTLKESIDGSFDLDEGFITVEERGPELSLIVIEKRIRVANNPILFAMLRFNPDGLAHLLSHWINVSALKFGA